MDVWPHPDSDKLFCEKIDCGEAFGGVREVASGLQKHYKVEDLKDRMVLVAANLKAKKLGGFPSHGMVLCASTADGLSFVDPPKGAKPGDAVALPGLANPPASEAQVDKKKLVREGPAALRRPQRDLLLQGQAVRCQRGAVHGVRRRRRVDQLNLQRLSLGVSQLRKKRRVDGVKVDDVGRHTEGSAMASMAGGIQKRLLGLRAVVVRAQQRRAGAVARQVQRGRAPLVAHRAVLSRTRTPRTLAIRARRPRDRDPRRGAAASSRGPRPSDSGPPRPRGPRRPRRRAG